jgi:hypothetical protein
MGYGAEAETVNASTGRPANNALKLTSLASQGGLASQLNAVFGGRVSAALDCQAGDGYRHRGRDA